MTHTKALIVTNLSANRDEIQDSGILGENDDMYFHINYVFELENANSKLLDALKEVLPLIEDSIKGNYSPASFIPDIINQAIAKAERREI